MKGLSHQPSHFPHQCASVQFPAPGPLFRGEADTGASHLFLALQRLLIIPAGRSTAHHPHPAILSPWLVVLGICRTHEPRDLQPQPPCSQGRPLEHKCPRPRLKVRAVSTVVMAVAWPRKAQEQQTPSATPALQQQTHICTAGSARGDAQGSSCPCSWTAWWEGSRGEQGLLTPQAAPREE